MKSAITVGGALIFLTAIMSFAPRAHAYNERNYCIDQCYTRWACTSQHENDASCSGYQNSCLADCNNLPNDAPPPAVGAYGAIAYDRKSGAWGMADASENKSEAKKSAMSYCNQHGQDCTIEETFHNTCVAVAAGLGSAFAYANDDDAKTAGLKAIDKCSKQTTGPRCFLQLWHCYSE
jgi:hypothetical protein